MDDERLETLRELAQAELDDARREAIREAGGDPDDPDWAQDIDPGIIDRAFSGMTPNLDELAAELKKREKRRREE